MEVERVTPGGADRDVVGMVRWRSPELPPGQAISRLHPCGAIPREQATRALALLRFPSIISGNIPFGHTSVPLPIVHPASIREFPCAGSDRCLAVRDSR